MSNHFHPWMKTPFVFGGNKVVDFTIWWLITCHLCSTECNKHLRAYSRTNRRILALVASMLNEIKHTLCCLGDFHAIKFDKSRYFFGQGCINRTETTCFENWWSHLTQLASSSRSFYFWFYFRSWRVCSISPFKFGFLPSRRKRSLLLHVHTISTANVFFIETYRKHPLFCWVFRLIRQDKLSD